MKKITSLFTLLLLAFCSIGASAQTTVTLDGTSTSGGTFYKIVSNAETAQTNANQYCYKWVSSASPAITLRVAPGTYGNLLSYQSGGFAMYRGSSGLTNNTLAYTLSIADDYYITDIELQFHNIEAGQNITLSCNGSSATATSTTDDVTLAVSDIDAQSVTINLTADNNKGCLVSVFKVTYEAKPTYAPISRVGAGELEYGVNYMIFNTANTPESYPHRWGAVYYDGSIKTYGGAVPESFSTNDTKYLFQLSDANTLYSVGRSANVGTSYSFTPWQDGAAADKGDVFSRNDDGTNIASSSIDASTKVWLINKGEGDRPYWNGNNWNSVGDNCFAFWSIAQPYAIYTVSEVTVVHVTYILQETNGTEVSRTTVTQRANSAANAPSSMVSNSYSLSLSGTIGDDDCNIIVTRTPIETSIDFTDYEVRYDVTTTETSTITDGQWYLLTQVRGGESPAYDAGAGNPIKRAAANSVSITKGTDPATVSQYLVRFFSTGVGDGKYIQFGTGNFWKDVQSNASSATTYLVYPARNNSSEGYDGWAINNSVDGKTYERKIDNNSAGYNISYWGVGKTTTGTNNIWKLYPVELIYQPVTFDVVISDGNTSNTYNNLTFPNGEVITASDVLNISSDYISSTSHTVSSADAGQTINLTVTPNANLSNLHVSNTSVAATTSAIEEGQWYILTQTRRVDTNNQTCETAAYDNGVGNNIKRAAEGVTANSLLAQNTSASDISKYLVRFVSTGVGNGYYIQFGNGHYWGSDLTTTTNFFSAGSYLIYNATQNADNSTGWAINLTTDGTSYLNKVDNNGNGNNLVFWESGQTTSGTNNIWKLYPVELDEPISFDVVLTDGTNSRTLSGVNSVIGATLTAADYLEISSQYITSDSHEITQADEGQTITLNCAFNNLPFTLSADPSDVSTATYYYMTLSQNYYCARNVATASSATLDDDNYLWAFGGSPVTGITVYNKAEGKYMNVGTSADNSRATFSTTPTFYTIKTNNQETNGFSLNVNETNAYINYRDGYVSTWLDTRGLNDKGSCLRVYTETELIAPLLEALAPYFTYAGSVGALTESAAAELNSIYQSFLANTPHSSLYLALKDAIDNNLVELSEGYYIVYSGDDRFTTPKAMYYNTSNNKIAWTTADGSAAQVMKLKAVSGTSNYRIYSPLTDKYLQTKVGATTDAEESGLILTVTPVSVGKVVLVYNANGGDDAALHTDGHNNGSGTSGNLKGWNITGAASLWRLYPLDIPEITLIEPNGVAKGDEVYQSFAYGSNKQLPLNVGVHYISANNGNFAHIETVSSSAIRANEGYIIRGVKGATVPLLPIGEVDALSSTNLLVGVVEPTKVYSGYMLAYKGNDAEQKFYKIKNTGLTIPAYRSYLTAAAAANVRGLELLFGGIGDDEITGIDGINTGGTEGAIFDLQGRRVTKPEKGGIYIINGKKVMK